MIPALYISTFIDNHNHPGNTTSPDGPDTANPDDSDESGKTRTGRNPLVAGRNKDGNPEQPSKVWQCLNRET